MNTTWLRKMFRHYFSRR